ncbi:TPA: hypothetical protein QDB24_002975 [Burkholderia vietnamiensis]|uniref:hypothetical protein n=1 Tax=Burkholderia vietnamiensis TaxID=60552 RepID=UPI001B92E946|nr:hypothetical protein [Burkholderia vietnamiensis]MBR7910346.1 hypothetical protein [Burkholderia vietnamiensis]HDR9274894.1 hypothetical protein [Burkholderia vietnamiensis]
MIPRNLKHVGPYADRVNSRSPANDLPSAPFPEDCKGALIDPESGAPFLPWGPRIDPCQLKAMQRELFEVVDALAKLEGWPERDYDHVVMCIERQPISTLRPDLAYFAERLRGARTESAAREAIAKRSWRSGR